MKIFVRLQCFQNLVVRLVHGRGVQKSEKKNTHKEVEIKAYSEVTGTELPPRVTVAGIHEYSNALPEDQRKRYLELYLHYMSIGIDTQVTQNKNL